MTKKHFLILFFMISFAIAAYFPSINSGYFADDYGYKFLDTKFNIQTILSPAHGYAYRPIERAFLITVQKLFGANTLLIHMTYLIVHILFCSCIMIWMQKKGFSIFCSVITFGVMLLSQANAHAVSSIDTFSQISSTFTGYASTAYYLHFVEKGFCKPKHYLYSLLLYFIALFCKETALSFAMLNFIAGSYYSLKWCYSRATKNTIIHLFKSLIPFLLLTIFFMVLRKYLSLTPPSLGTERFNIKWGSNIAINFILAIVQAFQPHSSVALYFDIVNLNILNVLPVMLFTIFIAGLTLRGLQQKSDSYNSIIVIIALPSALFPVILFNHISELYIYNIMPAVAILIGSGLGTIFHKADIRIKKAAVLVLISGYLCWNTISVSKKSELINQNGSEAEKLLVQIQPFYSDIPNHGKLILVNPKTSYKTEYSIYKRTCFRLFEDGIQELHRRSKRNDFEIKIIMQNQLAATDTSHSIILKRCNGRVVKISPETKMDISIKNSSWQTGHLYTMFYYQHHLKRIE